MSGWTIAGIIVAAVFVLHLWMIFPCVRRKENLKPFEKNYIAHRGLFDNTSNAPENSMPAFARAVAAGYGIELDVQMTADKKLVVFHDWTMQRMAGVDLRITETTYDELCRYPLGQSQEVVPLFEDVLRLVDGKVPMIIEIKVGFSWKETTKAIAEMLKHYSGVYCMECFHPFALGWYKRNHPEILRGLLSMDYAKDPVRIPAPVKLVLTNLYLDFIARPDFISYHFCDDKKYGFRLCRHLFGAKTAAWTIRSEADLTYAAKNFDIFIFDSFHPKNDITALGKKEKHIA